MRNEAETLRVWVEPTQLRRRCCRWWSEWGGAPEVTVHMRACVCVCVCVTSCTSLQPPPACCVSIRTFVLVKQEALSLSY